MRNHLQTLKQAIKKIQKLKPGYAQEVLLTIANRYKWQKPSDFGLYFPYLLNLQPKKHKQQFQ
jgi:hypothetical protein